jgi:hypothetical protein
LVLGLFGFKYYIARQLMTLAIALLIATTSYRHHSSVESFGKDISSVWARRTDKGIDWEPNTGSEPTV